MRDQALDLRAFRTVADYNYLEVQRAVTHEGRSLNQDGMPFLLDDTADAYESGH